MKLSNPQINSFIQSPPAGIKAALVYGPDSGLAIERSKLILHAILGPNPDPFNIVEIWNIIVNK